MTIRSLALAAIATTFCLTGCHRPHGALLSYAGGSYTYYSYETAPKTIRVLDLRSDDVVFTMDVPAGKQLTIQFLEGKGDDPVYTPDAMQYEVMEMGTTTGSLANMMSVPGAGNRRIEVMLRQGPEYAEAEADQVLRTDQLIDRPDWWSPRGGPLPEDRLGSRMYDR